MEERKGLSWEVDDEVDNGGISAVGFDRVALMNSLIDLLGLWWGLVRICEANLERLGRRSGGPCGGCRRRASISFGVFV
jgi:hypothetical protein